MKVNFDTEDESFSIELMPAGKSYRARLGEKELDVQILQAEKGKLELLIDGKRVTAYVSSDHTRRWVTVNGRTLLLNKDTGRRRSGGAHQHAAGELTAPMPGQVRAVNVNEGEKVSKGQTLLLLEAMKMEIRIQAPEDGAVRKLFVKQGQTVERDQTLVEIAEN